MLWLWIPLLVASASAADLEIETTGLVRVQVDDRPARKVAGQRGSWAIGLADGEHTVRVLSLLRQTRATMQVQVQGEERVILHYSRGQLQEVARGRSLAVERAAREMTRAAAQAAASSAMAAEAEAQAAAAHARATQAQADAAKAAQVAAEVQALLLAPGFGEAAEGMTLAQRAASAEPRLSGLSAGTGGPAIASASWAGLDPALFSLRLDERAVEYSPALGAFVATDLEPGMSSLVIGLEGEEALSADFRTEAGRHVACTVLARADGYDHGCVAGGAALTSADLLRSRAVQPGASAAVLAQVMDEAMLRALIESVQGTPYAREKVGVLSSAAERHRFSCAQVVRLLEALPFNDDKVAGVRALRPVILDPENSFLIEEAFTFAEHRAKVREMFASP